MTPEERRMSGRRFILPKLPFGALCKEGLNRFIS